MSIDIGRLELMETKQYRSLSKESGKEYAQEFIQKGTQQLKEAIFRYMVEKNKVEAEMEENPKYSLALSAVKKRKEILKDNLKSPKVLADLALEVLERASENHTPDDTATEDTAAYKAVNRVYNAEKASNLLKQSEEDLNEVILAFQTTKKHLEHEMKQEPRYIEHSEIVKLFQKAAKDSVKPQKCCADMAIELLRRQKETDHEG